MPQQVAMHVPGFPAVEAFDKKSLLQAMYDRAGDVLRFHSTAQGAFPGTKSSAFLGFDSLLTEQQH
jgi:hypothetical protein